MAETMLTRLLLCGLSMQMLLASHFVHSSVVASGRNGINYKNRCPSAKVKYNGEFTVVTYKLKSRLRYSDLECQFKYKGLWHTHIWFSTDERYHCYNTKSKLTFNNESWVSGSGYISTDLQDPRVTLFVGRGCYVNVTLKLSYSGYNRDVLDRITREPKRLTTAPTTESPYDKISTPRYHWWQVWRKGLYTRRIMTATEHSHIDNSGTRREAITQDDHITKKTAVPLIATGCAVLVLVLVAAIFVIIIKRRRNQNIKFHLVKDYDNPNFKKSLSIETVTGKNEKSSSKTFGPETSDTKAILDYQEADMIDTKDFGSEHHA